MISDVSKYQVSLGVHKKQDVIWIKFPRDFQLMAEIRKLKGSTWSASKKCWYVRDTPVFRQLFHIPLKNMGKAALQKIHAVNRPALQRLQEQMKLRAFSPNAIRTYSVEFAQLLYTLNNNPVDELTPDNTLFLFFILHRNVEDKRKHPAHPH